MAKVILKRGHVQPLWSGHPWVYAQAIQRIDGHVDQGDEISVFDPEDRLIGRGFYSPGSAIPIRILVRDGTSEIDGAFFEKRMAEAALRRTMFGLGDPQSGSTGYRLIHAEGDLLPGLVVDQFGDCLVVQFLTAGMSKRKALLLEELVRLFSPKTIVSRTPENIKKLEQLQDADGVVYGDEPSCYIFSERRFCYELPTSLTQKTGFYFDQRGLRARVEELAKGRRVLDAYCYVGSFGLSAARGGASLVHCVDENSAVLEVAAELAKRNGLPQCELICSDARTFLRDQKDKGGHADRYDMVIIDPPRLAPTKASLPKALAHYSHLAELACHATVNGGLVIFCSCSAAIDLESLTRALAVGGRRADASLTILERHFQGCDHPVLASFREGSYLKALVVQVLKK